LVVLLRWVALGLRAVRGVGIVCTRRLLAVLLPRGGRVLALTVVRVGLLPVLRITALASGHAAARVIAGPTLTVGALRLTLTVRARLALTVGIRSGLALAVGIRSGLTLAVGVAPGLSLAIGMPRRLTLTGLTLSVGALTEVWRSCRSARSRGILRTLVRIGG
jgi:hypothetical protein